MSLSIVIAVFNEADTIETEIRSMNESIVQKITDVEWIIAEDGSTDGTKEILKKLNQEFSFSYVTNPHRKGYTTALKDALNLATKEYVFFSDTGNKHNMNDFWLLYPYHTDHELVIGHKTNRKDQWYRQCLTFGYNKLLSYYFKIKIKDADSGFRIYHRKAMRKVINEEWINHELIASEITLRMLASKIKCKEVPISYKQRKGSSKGLPLKKIPKTIIGVLKNFPKLKKELYHDPKYDHHKSPVPH